MQEIFEPIMTGDGFLGRLMRDGVGSDGSGIKNLFLADMNRPERIPGTNIELSLIQKVMAVLNMGNEGNKQRLSDGRGWSYRDADGQIIPGNDLQRILDTMDDTQMEFVQNILNFFESYYEPVTEKNKRVKGVHLERVEPTVMRHSTLGEFAGGYFPAMYEYKDGFNVGSEATLAAEKHARGYANKMFKASHNEPRNDAVYGEKIRLDINVIFEHVEGVIRDLSWHEWLIDTRKLLSNDAMIDQIKTQYGQEVYREIDKFLEDMIGGEVYSTEPLGQIMDYIRKGSSVAAMAYNTNVALLQLSGITQSIERLGSDGTSGAKWIGIGAAKYAKAKSGEEGSIGWIMEQDSFMRHRGQTMNREIREISMAMKQIDRGSKSGALKWIDRNNFLFIMKAQQQTDAITWNGSYEKARSEGLGHEEAVAHARRDVTASQGSGTLQERARVERGDWKNQMLMQFGAFFNTVLQRNAQAMRLTQFRDPASVVNYAFKLFQINVLPAAISSLMIDALFNDWDEEESWAAYFTRATASWTLGQWAGVRELAGTASGFTNYQGPAGYRGIPATVQVATQAGQWLEGGLHSDDIDDAFVKSIIQAAGIAFHKPATLVERAYEGIGEWLEGEGNPLSPVIGTRKQQ
jgi:hypothetical protein